MSKTIQNTYTKTGLAIGRTYTRQKIRIALGKIYPSSNVLQAFSELENNGTLTLASKNPMCQNLDQFTLTNKLL